MGYRDLDMCFSTENLDKNLTIETLNQIIKPDFSLKNESLFLKPQMINLEYLLIRYQKNTANDNLLNVNYKTKYQNLQVLPLMKDQVQLILQNVEVDTYSDSVNYLGTLSFIQSGIDLPFIIRDNQKYSNSQRQFVVNTDKSHTLNEFIYTFQKMGISITQPVLKGIKDYSSSQVNHILLQIAKQTHQISSFTVYFMLPDFSIMPEIYLSQVSGNLNILFDGLDHTKAQAYINVNAIFTFNGQNYYANIIRKAFEGNQIKVLEETKIFPEYSQLQNIPQTLNDFARIITLTPHSEIFPDENNFHLLLKRLNLLSLDSRIDDPKIKLINQPLRVVRVSGIFSGFERGDSDYMGVLTSLNGELAVTQSLLFEGSQANNAMWKLFNFKHLVRRDKLEINAFKLLQMKLIINNIDLAKYSKILGSQSNNFLSKGIQIELNMELKKFCQADIFCMMLTKFYGSMFIFNLKGKVHPIESKISLQTQLQDIKFNNNYILDNAYLKLDISYKNISEPDIDIYVEGDLLAEIQIGEQLKFLSRIQLSDEGVLRLKGEMNRVFVNAFNLNNMLNTTQMSIMTIIDQEGMLGELQITAIGVFGADCYKVSTIPEIFSTDLPYPKFGTKQQQQLLALLNQSYIDEDKCETANINMITYPNNTKENFFKGKLNLINLKQFYQIFFNKIADQLTALTPDNIREQELISHQVDLLYDPGFVYINGVTLTGAFNFNGLMNFHGLTAHVRLVMDPDYQKYLYFSIVLPSFSLSQQNIKFLSPIEYTEVLEDDTKAILYAFGAPKIDMQIPIEELSVNNTKFQIRGMLSLMGMHQLITCDFEEQRLNIKMQGQPYSGLYRMDFKVFTIIQSGHISENIASIFGVFDNDSNLRQIEQYLSKSIEDWTSTGLQYLQAWRDRISNLQNTIATVEKTEYCDPNSCPSYSQCSSNLVIDCQQYLEEYECVKYDDICTDLQQKCTKISKICLKKDKFTNQCINEMEICEEWQNICMGFDQQICKKFRIKPENKVNKVCKVYDLSCKMQTRFDQDCFMRCTQVQQNYNQYSDLLKIYQNILNQTEQLMGNLTALDNHLSQMREQDQNLTFVKLINMTLEGLLDTYMLPQNTNISFEVSYLSPFDDKQRLVRTAIDFHSNSETAKILRPFILEDICNIYGIPANLATRMNQIIEDIEGSIRMLQRQNNLTQEQIQQKFNQIVHSNGLYDLSDRNISIAINSRNQSSNIQLSRVQNRMSLVEKRLSQLMLHKQLENTNQLRENNDDGLQTEHLNDVKNQYLLNENEIYTLSEFMSEK